MFWGLNLKPNRKYSQTTSKNFHISGASLEDGDVSKVYVTSGNQKFLICTLESKNCKQVFLDLNFAEGEEVCFQTVGSGNVALSGYIVNEYDDEDSAEEDDEDELSDSEILKELAKSAKSKKKTQKTEGDDDEEDEDEGEDNEDDDDDSELDVDDMDVEDDNEDDEDEDEEDDDDSDDEDVQPPKAKHPKLEKAQAKQNGVVKKTEEVETANKKSKKDKKAAAKKENQKPQQQQQKQQQQNAGGERTITGGVKVEDIRVGSGPDAKSGKRVLVYYEGRLKSNNKVFDSLKQGSGFKFTLGRGEVIKGWDAGVAGMKVGGKRRITCPPHMGYGARGSAPAIPPNSTLVFEVELKGVN